ncbi:MAG: calcium-binding protein [Hyphomicrobiaceae bacterium]
MPASTNGLIGLDGLPIGDATEGDDVFQLLRLDPGFWALDGLGGGDTLDLTALEPLADDKHIVLDEYGMLTNGSGAYVGLVNVETVVGSTGDDRLALSDGVSVVVGGSGNDLMSARLDSSGFMDGSEGYDTYAVESTGDVMIDDSGDTADSYAVRGSGTTSVTDHIGDDIYEIYDGTTTITDGSGNDTYKLQGFQSLAIFDTGMGEDVLDVSNATAGVSIDLGLGTIALGGSTGILSGIETIIGTELDDSITGDGNDNAFLVTSGFDTYSGGAGLDTLAFTNYYFTPADFVVANLETGTVAWSFHDWSTWNSQGGCLIEGIEYFEFGERAGLVLGTDAGDVIGLVKRFGLNAFGDTIVGGAGSDTITGGSGRDVLIGSDFAAGGTAGDLDVISGGGGNDRIYAGLNTAASMSGGTGYDTLWGGTLADTLIMGAGDATHTPSGNERDQAAGLGGSDRFEVTETLTSGAWSHILDFNDDAWSTEPDTLVLSAAYQNSYTIEDTAYGARVNITLADGGWYGVLLANMTAAGLADQIAFA